MRSRVQNAAFDPGAEVSAFSYGLDGVGAVVSFSGIVRQVESGDLQALEIEHYPGMTEAAIEAIRQQAVTRFHLADALVIHRYGRLHLGEPIMMVATAAAHRADAFAGAEMLMDYLKSEAPFWKKEIKNSGANWVDAIEADAQRRARWD